MTPLLYITNARIPTEKAHGIQIIKMCEAFQAQGAAVELIIPFRFQSRAMKQVRDMWQYYAVATSFRIRRLLTPDFIILDHLLPERLLKGLYVVQCLLFAFIAVGWTWRNGQWVYYTRDVYAMLVLGMMKSLHRRTIVFEAHELHGRPDDPGWRSRFLRRMLQRVDLLVVLTQRLKDDYLKFGFADQRILIMPDGIDSQRLAQRIEKTDARQRLNIPPDQKMVCYTGHLFRWKGVYTLVEAGEYLSEQCVIYIVGGMTADLAALRSFIAAQGVQNVVTTGHIPYTEIPVYLSAADVLVAPNSAQVSISRDYTSPLKLFEYMGAQRPIVASDLPSLREVLRHQENAYLTPPDQPHALAAGILTVLAQPALADRLAQTAYRDVQQFTWEQRAQVILDRCGFDMRSAAHLV